MQFTERAFVPYRVRLQAAADLSPERIALCDGARSVTYSETIGLIDAFAAHLFGKGIRPGEVLAICASNSLEYAIAYLGAVSLGVVVAPLPTGATAAALAGMIADCSASLVLADADNLERIESSGARVTIEPLETLLERLDPSAPPPPRGDIAPDDVFNIIYSSGTTGKPKGIVQSNAMRDAHVELARACGYDHESVTLVSTPLYSNTTLVSFLPTIALGGTVVLMAKFDAARFLELAERHRVTHAMLVPVQYQRLLACEAFDAHDLSAFREKFCTSAPFSAELKRQVLDRWPGGLTEYYGMTEGGGLCILFADRHPDKLHTVGQPAPENDIRIIDEDGGQLPPGEAGEVVGRSRSIMKGYHNLAEATNVAFWTSPDGYRFIRTGDVGRFDEDGFLILMDRKKDVIISGGFNIYPSDLEEVIRSHPRVQDVAVVGVDSPEWGETPVAFIVAPGATAEELLSFANQRVGKLQRLKGARLVERLPRNAIGKILKRELRDIWSEEGSKAAHPA